MHWSMRPREDEIVEDSEPEREQLRLQKKVHRKKASNAVVEQIRTVRNPNLQHKADRLRSQSVISISDRSRSSLADRKGRKGHAHLYPPNDGRESQDDLGMSALSDIEVISRLPSGPSVHLETSDAEILGRARLPMQSVPQETEPDEASQRITGRFSHYAFVAPKNSTRPSASRAGSIVPNVAPAKHSTTRALHAAAYKFSTFSDADFMRLLKCVSCELSWTPRKTVAQKLKHIRSCARKHQLDEQIVTTLIREELVQSLSKDVDDHPTTPNEQPQTYLENIVRDEVVKKKGRRPQVQASIKELAATRQDILDRARTLLESSSTKTADEPKDISPPPLTQAFGQSALAARFQTKALILTQLPIYVPSTSEIQPLIGSSGLHMTPPKELAFGKGSPTSFAQAGTSKIEEDRLSIYTSSPLAQRNKSFEHQELSSPQRTDLHEDIHSLAGPSFYGGPTCEAGGYNRNPILGPSSAPNYLFPYDSGNEAGRHLRYSPNSPAESGSANVPPPLHSVPNSQRVYIRDAQSDTSPYDSVDSDDAILHYEPAGLCYTEAIDDLSSVLSSVSLLDEPLPTHSGSVVDESKRKPSRRKPKLLALSSSESEAHPIGLYRAKKAKKARSKKQKEAPRAPQTILMTDEELYTHLQSSILNDRELHHRVLRYEPVNFDVFLKLATDPGVSTRGLEIRVKDFLDKQAIHFSIPKVFRKARLRKPR
ncbi:hypothetical protein BDW22DRAFT_1351967 [Trametopsis cervina]|nr:hypothetical protein BDW22DRAFT_1351967 [Trametopsis cervina]